MLVLHGFWSSEHGLCLWAEDSAPAVKSRISRAVRPPHPLLRQPPGALLHAGRRRGCPAAASLRTARLTPRTDQIVRVLPHGRKPCCCHGAFLSSCLTRQPRFTALAEHAPEIRYGASLGLPGPCGRVREGPGVRGRCCQRWSATSRGRGQMATVLAGHDVMPMHSLIRAMPPVCRAVPGSDDPHEQLTIALSAMVDVAAREALRMACRSRPSAGDAAVPAGCCRGLADALRSPGGRLELTPIAGCSREALRPWDDEGDWPDRPAR